MEYVSRSGPVQSGIIPMGAGGVVGFGDYGGVSGGDSYHKAYQTSLAVRMAPDTIAKSVRASWDEPFYQEISPAKPEAVSMVGADVFGPPSFHSTVRNTLLDLRGEAATGVVTGEPPSGASEVSWASYAVPNGPASVGLGCGTCAKNFEAPSPVSQPPKVGSFGNPAAIPRRKNIWSKIRNAFYM